MAATKVGFQLESSLASKHLTDAIFIKGGYLVVASIQERDGLKVATSTDDGTIVEGSLCYCQEDDKFYQYDGSAWKEFKLPTHTSELINDSNFVTTSTDKDTTYDLSAPANKSNGSVTIDLAASGSGSGTDSISIKGSGATSVTTDANGIITINSSNTETTLTVGDKSNTDTTDLVYAITNLVESGDKGHTLTPTYVGLPTKTYVDNKVADLVDSSPEALNTLNELAAALGDDPNFAATVAEKIGKKVDKVEGKGLSTNDYTTAEKNKLTGIADGANKTIVDTTLNASSENPVQNKVINTALGNKVDKVDGKGLSTNDLTAALKTNYDAAYQHSTSAHAPDNAQANIIEAIQVNNVALDINNKTVNILVPTKISDLTNDSFEEITSNDITGAFDAVFPEYAPFSTESE